LRDRLVGRGSTRVLSQCCFRTTNTICSFAFSIGPSQMDEPPETVGQSHLAAWASLALPVTLVKLRSLATVMKA
jgi:hypothetical protein